MSNKIWFDPTYDKWVLSDGEHYLEVPHWAREIIADEFERETRRLKDKLQRRTEQFEGMTEMWVERGVENAELRELMRHLHTCMEHYEMDGTISCDRCPLDNDTGNCDFERRMRDLGVEVDG